MLSLPSVELWGAPHLGPLNPSLSTSSNPLDSVKNGLYLLADTPCSLPSYLPSTSGLPFYPAPAAVPTHGGVCPFTLWSSQEAWLFIPQVRIVKFCLVPASAQDRAQQASSQCLLHLTKPSRKASFVG